MKLSILVVIVLRLFAITWAVRGGIGLLTALGTAQTFHSSPLGRVLETSMMFAVPAAYVFLAFVAWVFAEAISRRVVGAVDVDLGLSLITAENLYALGFLGIGLHYSLANLATSIHWLHYIVVHRAGQSVIDGRDGHALYDVTSALIPCVAGTVIAMLSPKLGRRLARSIDRLEKRHPGQSVSGETTSSEESGPDRD